MLIFADLDGSLFDNIQRKEHLPADGRTTADWEQFNSLHIYDKPIQYRIDFLRVMACEHLVFYVTSRTVTHYDSTKAQLAMHGCPPGRLIMRPEYEHRPGSDFKADVIEDVLREYGIQDERFLVIDDDHRICERIKDDYPSATIILVPSACCAYLAQTAKAVAHEPY